MIGRDQGPGFGPPRGAAEILTDNVKVFTRRFGAKDTEVLFGRICRENGIDHLPLRRPAVPRPPPTTRGGTTRQRIATGMSLGRRTFGCSRSRSARGRSHCRARCVAEVVMHFGEPLGAWNGRDRQSDRLDYASRVSSAQRKGSCGLMSFHVASRCLLGGGSV